MTTSTRIQISRDDFLKTFAELYNQSKPLDVVPPIIDKEIREKLPLTHLFSSYVIRPSAFDRDPFSLPKTQNQNTKQRPATTRPLDSQQPNKRPAQKAAAHLDDFETVEAPAKKEKKKETPSEKTIKPETSVKNNEEVPPVPTKMQPTKNDSTITQKPLQSIKVVPEIQPPKPIAPLTPSVQSTSVPLTEQEESKVVFLKGPRPKGLKKFKPLSVEEPETPPEELSENQKRKLEKARQKAEAAKQKEIDDELLRQQQEVQAEAARKMKIEQERIAAEKKFQDDQRRKMEEKFQALGNSQPDPIPASSVKKQQFQKK